MYLTICYLDFTSYEIDFNGFEIDVLNYGFTDKRHENDFNSYEIDMLNYLGSPSCVDHKWNNKEKEERE
ncbi:hypothetical protein M5689_021091 [Euphorbia peplus]|nr:hypothetical protein M5689_021091 [Euphorbia peplus]